MAFKNPLNPFALLLALTFMLIPSLVQMAAAQTDNRGLTTQKVQQKELRIALVIGNSAYNDAPLRNPVNDARDMAQALRDVGFEVIYGENLSQNDLKRSIRAFGDKIHNGGIGLFYYAGHGIQVNGVNYLVPVGATITKEEEAEYESVDVGFVLAQMENAKNRLNIVILDACRNNPFARSFRSTKSGLASIDAPSGTLIAYATAPGSVASDGDGRNGLYTQELLRQIRTASLSIEQIFKQVRVAVRDKTQGKQIPWESSSLTGDFRFSSMKESVNENDPRSIEISDWEAIKRSTNPADFQAYLQKYPNGMFADMAKWRTQPTSSPLLPSIDEVLENYFKAIGVRDTTNQLLTLEQKGLYIVAQGDKRIEGKIEHYQKRPGKSLTIIRAGSIITKEVFEGTKGWVYNSKTGTKEATARQLELYQRTVVWDEGDISKIKRLYSKITVRGKEKLGDREVFVLDATLPDNKVESLYFDVQSGLLIRNDVILDSVATQSGLAIPIQVYFDDYVDVNGIMVPLTMREIFIGSSIIIRYNFIDLKFNIPLDDNMFTKP
ncbi:MAG: hypothetical protein V7641_3105 [Blastocatellia bacterium]